MSAQATGAAATRPARRRRARPAVSVLVCLAILAVTLVCAVAGGWIAPHALDQDITLGTTPAGTPGHLLGTDQLGRDVLQLTVAGARTAVVGPVVVALGSLLLGLALGIPAGFRGGLADGAVTAYTDLTLSMPAMLLAIVVAGVMGGGYWLTVAVFVVLFSPGDIRLVRSAALRERGLPYIDATRTLGLPDRIVMVRHILPNVAQLALTNFFLNVGYALVSISSLSFLGLGPGPGQADWGRQLADGRAILFDNPAAAVVPGIAIILVATAFNLVGDAMADRLERRSA